MAFVFVSVADAFAQKRFPECAPSTTSNSSSVKKYPYNPYFCETVVEVGEVKILGQTWHGSYSGTVKNFISGKQWVQEPARQYGAGTFTVLGTQNYIF